MNYLHEHCDGCHQPFLPDDDIVVCPVCATPQHRACYEANGCCVNESKHDSGFVWSGGKTPAAADTVPCPNCGFLNRRDARLCIGCGALLQPASVQPAKPTRDLFFDVPDTENLELDEDQREQLETLFNQRAALAAPGMTAEQEEEQLAGQPIRQTMTFIGSNALRYLQKFRKLEGGGKTGWNWAAFFLSPYWFFYRKMYKPGVVFLTLRLCLTLLLMPYETKALELYQSLFANASDMSDAALAAAQQQLFTAVIPIYIGVGVLLVLAVVSALLADRLYLGYVRASLQTAKAQQGRDAFLLQFFKRGGVSPLLGVLSYLLVSFVPSMIYTFINR